MKFAVVPYRATKVSGGKPEVRIQDHWLPLNIGTGKLTQEQVEAMAEAYLFAQSKASSVNQRLVIALKSVGIEVE